MKKTSLIVHVEFKSGPYSGKNFYFGGISAIYEKLSPTDIGVSKSRLYQVKINEANPYENKICIVRRGCVNRKSGNRMQAKKPVKVRTIRVT